MIVRPALNAAARGPCPWGDQILRHLDLPPTLGAICVDLAHAVAPGYAATGSSIRRGMSVSRAITRRWICDVPS